MKKAECRRIGAFELWCWWRLLRVPWIARRSNQSILKEISPGCSLEGMMLKLKLQYFGHLMWRGSSEKTLMLGGLGARGEGDDRGWNGWMASLTQWTWVWVNSGRWWWTGRIGVLWFIGSNTTEWLNWWYVFFCDWLLSLIFLRFIHVVAHIRTFLKNCWIIFCSMNILHFSYPYISWWTFGLFPLFHYFE